MTNQEENDIFKHFDEAAGAGFAAQCRAETEQNKSSPTPVGYLGLAPALAASALGTPAALRSVQKNDPSRFTSAHGFQKPAEIPGFRVLGVRVHAARMSDALERLRSWIAAPRNLARYVAITGMHGIAESRKSVQFRLILNQAGLVLPDGMPLVWLARIKGFPLPRRVTGSELMDSFCSTTGAAYRHFFYGAGPGVADHLAQSLHEKYGIVIAGTYSPPFRPLTAAEEKNLAALVNESAPDVLWVGLSTPKQEKWMYEHRRKLKVPVMLGVGAAFDMNSGNLRRAPKWMQDSGLEWLFRLGAEPGRLWKRYLITIPEAVWFVGLELLQFPKFRSAGRSYAVDAAENSAQGSD